MTFRIPKEMELHRVPLFGKFGDMQNGAFEVRHKGLHIIVSSDEGWEHVSVSRKSRIPTYDDMCYAKDLFWTDDECAMQLHVPKSEHVNCHPFCLHLWRPINETIPRPPAIFVGSKS